MPPKLKALSIVALLSAALAVATPGTASAATSITVDGTGGGRVFDGIGAISGGGGNSRLLVDYPEPQRSQILDYLFKPGYGAALHILKVEIGGDTNSTDGAERSHQHTRGAINCNAGYEFWLMEQAKARNPSIKLYGLAWGAPGWVGGGSFWSQDMVDYLVSWLDCAKSHGLTVDYLGGWNEKGYDKSWYENLHSTLPTKGYGNVKVVGADGDWDVADDMQADPAFKAAVDIVGTHYKCGYLSNADSCETTTNALATGKQLWASENGSMDQNIGSGPLIRSIIRGYVDSKVTAYLNWPIIASLYPNLPYATVGLMSAGQPWSGAYTIGKNAWATAHVTQFSQPGWRFIDSASGYLGGNRANGSYATLKSPNGQDYSTIFETSTAQNVTMSVRGGLSTGPVHVWATNLNSVNQADFFVHTNDITPMNGTYSLTLQPGYVYTVSTTTGQGKGSATSPAFKSLPLPYTDDFESYATESEPRLLSAMQGAYEVKPCAAGRAGRCVQQVAPVKPIEWQDDSDAFALLGDTGWHNYTVSADVELQQAGTVEILGRAGEQYRPQSQQSGYFLRASNNGGWSIVKSTADGGTTTLRSGTVAALGTGRWHTLALTFQDSTITAAIDGTTVGTAQDTAYPRGQVGIGVVGYQTQQFDNLKVVAGTGNGSGPVPSGIDGKCLDLDGNNSANGTAVQIWDCNGGPGQQWTAQADGTVRSNGKCLDINGQGTANETIVQLWECNGGANQKWQTGAGASLVNPVSGRCLDDPGASTGNGTQLIIWDCNGGSNQKWTLN